MIAFLEGILAEKGAGRVVIAAGGIGYEVQVPTRTLAALPATGRPARLHTRLQVRDDAMALFGFSTTDERELFDLLTTVTGVGPKVAMAILSALPPEALRRAIATDDPAALTVVPGVGRKVAARVVLDLRDRVGAVVEATPGGPVAEVREALLALGLSPEEAREALSGLAEDADASVEELLRRALQGVGR